jgi:hypothetical protein
MSRLGQSMSKTVKSQNKRIESYVKTFNSKPKTFQSLLYLEREKVGVWRPGAVRAGAAAAAALSGARARAVPFPPLVSECTATQMARS